jgi:sulfide:quinone oxidoreductase
MLVDALLRRRGVRDAVSIEVSIPDPEPMPVAGPHAGPAVRALLAERGIALRSASPVASVDAGGGAVVFADGGRLAYDLLLAVPPHRAPRVVRDARLTDSTGWIPVDPATLATTHPNVFAIGDVAAVKLPGPGLLPKAGIMAERQGEVVGANLLAALSGRAPERRFDGVGYCFFEVGDRQAMQVDGTFFEAPERRTRFTVPSAEGFAAKQRFERERLERWFG